jgi:hypothetical protein
LGGSDGGHVPSRPRADDDDLTFGQFSPLFQL